MIECRHEWVIPANLAGVKICAKCLEGRNLPAYIPGLGWSA